MSGLSSGFYRTGFAAAVTACAFLAGMLAGGRDPARAEGGETVTIGGRNAGGGTADSDRNMIAVTGTSTTGAAVLYLVDTKAKRLAVYQSSGKNIELVAARNIEFDLKIDSFRDASDDEVQVRKLRSEWVKSHAGQPGDGQGDAGK